MAYSDDDLEDNLLEVGSRLASPPLDDEEELLMLLDETESFLSKIEQSPFESMFDALRPVKNALVAKDLLEHSDMDVKVAVASCVSEITRITAPEAPYDDDLMKVIFHMIVEAFEKLDDESSRSYFKRISILETAAKVRLCVVMLDLECDALILEMFHHFLKTLRPNHPQNVFSSMEMIMTLVLEESEDISSDLLSCLLDSVKTDNKKILPNARKLVEKVIKKCAAKLKPYLMGLLSSSDPGEHIEFIASLFQENSDVEQDEIISSCEILVDDNKLSERTVADESSQGSEKVEQEVGSPEKDATAETSPRSVMSNDVVQRVDMNSVVEPPSPKQKPERSRRISRSKHNVAAIRAHSDNLQLETKKMKGQKCNSSDQATDISEHSLDNDDKESVASKTRGHNTEVDNSQVCGPSGKEVESAESLEPKVKDNLQLLHRSDNQSVSVSSLTPRENVLDTSKPKRGRLPGSKSSVKRPASAYEDKGALGNSQIHDQLHSDDNDLKKESEAIINSEENFHRRLGKIVQPVAADGVEKSASLVSNSEGKPVELTGKRGSRRKVKGRGSSGKKQKSYIKQPRGKEDVGKNSAGETSEDTQSKDESHLDDNRKTQIRRKRPRNTDESSQIDETPEQIPKLDQSLVGAHIKVWWPEDNRFYNGKVQSFDPDTGKHSILYTDDEVEVILLREERFELLGSGSEIDEDQAKDVPFPITSPEVSQSKRTKSNSGLKQGKTPASFKSGSSSKHDGSVGKRRGRPKGSGNLKGPRNMSKSKADSLKSSTRTPKTKSKGMDEASKTTTKAKPESPDMAKSRESTPKVGRKDKPKGNSTPKSMVDEIYSDGMAEESVTPAQALGSRASMGKKRRRRGRK